MTPKKNSGCRLHCLVELDDEDSALCNNSRAAEPEKSMSNDTATDDATDTGIYIYIYIYLQKKIYKQKK